MGPHGSGKGEWSLERESHGFESRPRQRLAMPLGRSYHSPLGTSVSSSVKQGVIGPEAHCEDEM